MSILEIILAVLVLLLVLRLRQSRRVIGHILEAARRGEPALLEEGGGFIRGSRLDRLTESFNRLISENRSISTSGQAFFARIQTTLGNLREAVLMVDEENTIRMANPAFNELLLVRGDPLGKRLEQFIQGEDFLEFLRHIRAGGEGGRQELELRVGGETRWFEVSAAPLKEGEDTAGRHTLFVFHNITRQKRLEKMRTEFVANVSHELRTPVTVIKGFAQTLIEDEAVLSPEEKTRFLKKIRSNSERLHNLLQDLLLLSRLESTGMVLHLEEVSVSALLREIADSWEPLVAEGGRRLILDLAEGRDVIEGDPLRLSQVVTNLVENAVRHARGYTEIRLVTRLEPEGVRILVQDDGAGIPEKDLPHIFQRFYRVDKGRSRESGGTGLGLSIVKHIVAQHHGLLQARSQKGQGTTIDVFLPYGSAGGVGE